MKKLINFGKYLQKMKEIRWLTLKIQKFKKLKKRLIISDNLISKYFIVVYNKRMITDICLNLILINYSIILP